MPDFPRLLRNTEPALRRGWHPVCPLGALETPQRVRLLGATYELGLVDGVPAVLAADAGRPFGVATSIGLVWLAPEEPAADLLDVPELGDPDYADGWLTPRETTAAAGLYLDNQLDATHFPFVHTTTFGAGASPLLPDYEVAETPGGFTATVAHEFRNTLDPGVADGLRPELQTRRLTYRFALPLQLQLRIEHLDTRQRTVILFATSPADERSTHLWVRFLRNDIDGYPGLAAASMTDILEFENRVVVEDLALQETFDVPGLPLDPALELPVKADRCGLHLRRLLRELCEAASRQAAMPPLDNAVAGGG